VYQYWQNFENFPRFMEHVDKVCVLGGNDRMSHFKLKGPLGKSVEFDAELTTDEPGKELGWNSRGGSMDTWGVVTLTKLDEASEVHVLMQWYGTPVGVIGEAISRMFQDPENMLEEYLMRFEDIVEGRVGSGVRQ
jgi:uncharacterized membrane protein